MKTENQSPSAGEILFRCLLFAVFVFLFLVAVKLFGDAASLMTQTYENAWNSLLTRLDNPFVALSIGIFLTAIMQSSSATTSIAVALVASGTLTVEQCVFFVMGANIGTSITSTIVSLGHIGDRSVFCRAYSASALQDMFNLMTTVFLFPLEYCFCYLSKAAHFLVGFLPMNEAAASSGGSWNPLPWLVDQPVIIITKILTACHLSNTFMAICMMIIALVLLFFALVRITENMKVLMADRIEEMLNRVLSKNGILGIFIGLAVTMIIQSSSITTSLLVPLVASGVLRLDTIYPILIGANIGTTITAIMAAMAYAGAGGVQGLTLGIVHFLFNFHGMCLYYPMKWFRLPLFGARYLSQMAGKSRAYVITWVALVFFGVPLLGIWLFG